MALYVLGTMKWLYVHGEYGNASKQSVNQIKETAYSFESN